MINLNYSDLIPYIKRPTVVSALLHALIIIVMVAGLPTPTPDPVELGTSYDVAFIAPDPVGEPETPPEPEPEQPALPPAPPPPPPIPEPVQSAVPEPPALPSPPERPEPEKLPEAPEPPPPRPDPPETRVQEKPKPPEPEARKSFAAALKDLKRELEPEPPTPVPQEEPKVDAPKIDADALRQSVKDALKKDTPEQARLLTPSGLKDNEMGRVREQIIGCWNPPVGARDAIDMRVRIEVLVGPDRVVQSARIVDSSKETSAQFAESALRAVYICRVLDLPPDKYDVWNQLYLTFTPRDLVY